MKYNFSKLFSVGGRIKKYETPSGGVSYNMDLFIPALGNNQFSHGQTATSILFDPNWKGNDKYKTVLDLEASQEYKDYTQYIIDNVDKDPTVMNYLRELEKITTNPHSSILFNPDGTLKENWKDTYTRLRNDGKYGYYHQNPTLKLPTPETLPTPEEPPIEEKPPLSFESDPKRTPSRWTDWMPLTAQWTNDMLTNYRNAELQKKMKVPLYSSPYNLHKVTNDYALRSAQLLNIDEMQAQALNQAGAINDLSLATKHLQEVGELATKLRNDSELLKANKFNLETATAEDVANQNKLWDTSYANQNMQNIVANNNNIIIANLNRNLNDLRATNSYIGNLTTSRNNYNLTENLNDASFLKFLNLRKYYDDVDTIEKTYKDLASDYTKSAAWDEFRKSTFAGADAPADANDDEWYKNLWENDGEFAQSFKSKYNKEIKDAYDAYETRMQNSYRKYQLANAQQPDYVTNQHLYRSRNYNFISPLFSKKGGQVRFIDYINHFQRELQSQRKEQLVANKHASDIVNKALDRLSKEELILLRSIFK